MLCCYFFGLLVFGKCLEIGLKLFVVIEWGPKVMFSESIARLFTVTGNGLGALSSSI